MVTIRRFGRFSLVAALGAALLQAGTARADVPPLLAEQGRLFDSSGVAVKGPKPFTFAIYDAATDGQLLWTETQPAVALSDGYFAVQLGTVVPLSAAIFDGHARWLGITVGSDSEMTPRQAITSVAYALVAGDAIGDITPRSVTVNGVHVIDSDGRWVGPSSGLVGPAGAEGAPGPKGDTGDKGDQGDRGDNGTDGMPGAAGAVGPAGPQGQAGPQGLSGIDGLSVTNEIEDPGEHCAQGGWKVTSASGIAYVCNGAPGADGALGLQGPPGADGAQGPAGADGAQGPQGTPGVDGAQGPQGVQGPQGSQGPQGIQGAPGTGGQSVVGSSLEVGDDNCPTGGAKYTSASGDHFVCNGVDGSMGPQGPSGVDGSMGPQGPSGVDGAQGPAGVDGAQGPAGADGAQGPQGAPGTPGADGAQGQQGAPGTSGVDGAQGPQGSQGSQGTAGADGQSVVGSSLAPGGPDCPTGGVKYTSASGDHFVCNGADGVSVAGLSLAIGDETCTNGGVLLTTASGASSVCNGADGAAGAQGLLGPIGPAGADGATGPAGPPGDPGVAGPTGPAGPAGYHTMHTLSGLTGTSFLSPIASETHSASELGSDVALIPLPCTMTTLTIFADSLIEPGQSVTYTLRAGTTIVAVDPTSATSDLAPTALSCTMGEGAQACSATGAVAVAANELVDVQVMVSGSTPAIHHVAVSLVCQ